MKKIFLFITLGLCLCACSDSNKEMDEETIIWLNDSTWYLSSDIEFVSEEVCEEVDTVLFLYPN